MIAQHIKQGNSGIIIWKEKISLGAKQKNCRKMQTADIGVKRTRKKKNEACWRISEKIGTIKLRTKPAGAEQNMHELFLRMEG